MRAIVEVAHVIATEGVSGRCKIGLGNAPSTSSVVYCQRQMRLRLDGPVTRKNSGKAEGALERDDSKRRAAVVESGNARRMCWQKPYTP